MLKWFRPGPSPHLTALAMIGAKAGDRVLVAADPDPALVAELARITGLNGQTAAAVTAGTRAAFDAAAAKAGSLVDLVEIGPSDRSSVPLLPTAPDIVVIAVTFGAMTPDARQTLVREALGAVRPGGRIIAADTARRAGWHGGGGGATVPQPEVVALLTGAGAVAARTLAESAGVTYYEARRAR
jgi:SAM-dependent methyltransferase